MAGDVQELIAKDGFGGDLGKGVDRLGVEALVKVDEASVVWGLGVFPGGMDVSDHAVASEVVAGRFGHWGPSLGLAVEIVARVGSGGDLADVSFPRAALVSDRT